MITLRVLIESLGLHLAWWSGALFGRRDPRAPRRPGRALVLLVGLPLFLLVQGVHAVCLLLDDLLFPRYRRIDVDGALFITGIPRSGTTFLHRTLAIDRDRYTTLTTWEALLAPSILQRRLVRGLGRLDTLVSRGLGRRGLRSLTRRLTGNLADIHAIGLEAAEEDYLALLPAGGCFILLLAFPGAPGLQALGDFDRAMPAGRRQRLLHFYRRCLQRHLYADGTDRVLLSKNAAFGSWIASLNQAFPRARFIICIREPVAALSSQLSAIASARTLFGTEVDSPGFQQLFFDMFTGTLTHLADTLTQWPAGRAVIIDMDDLGAEPARVLTEALKRLDVPVSEALRTHLSGLTGRERSRHRHSADALARPRAELEDALLPPYQRLRALPHLVTGASA